MEEKCEDMMETKGMGWRVSLSILVGVGWLVFVLLWFFFYADTYNWEKKRRNFPVISSCNLRCSWYSVGHLGH